MFAIRKFINDFLSGWTPFSNFSCEIEFRMDCLSFIIQMALRREAGLGLFQEKIEKFFRKTEWLDEILFINARAVQNYSKIISQNLVLVQNAPPSSPCRLSRALPF